MDKPDMLLHVCCAPCSTHVIRVLREQFNLTGFFFGPNIQPEAEYRLRRDEAERLAGEYSFPLLVGEYNPQGWCCSVVGLEGEEEGGARCTVCYRARLERTGMAAREESCEYFTTTLTVSPYKKASVINSIGGQAAEKYGVKFYSADFKKKDGFKKSCTISKELGLYRQNYCGCIYSLKAGKENSIASTQVGNISRPHAYGAGSDSRNKRFVRGLGLPGSSD